MFPLIQLPKKLEAGGLCPERQLRRHCVSINSTSEEVRSSGLRSSDGRQGVSINSTSEEVRRKMPAQA